MARVVRKLIEVALPLREINEAAAREKSIRHGHPSTLHLWWARRPPAAARAVLFAQLVDDPSLRPDLFPTKERHDRERNRLFAIRRDLVKWENTPREELLEGRGRRSGRVGGRPARTTPTTRELRSCSTRSGCRPSTIPSPGAGRSRWATGATPMPGLIEVPDLRPWRDHTVATRLAHEVPRKNSRSHLESLIIYLKSGTTPGMTMEGESSRPHRTKAQLGTWSCRTTPNSGRRSSGFIDPLFLNGRPPHSVYDRI